jgi:peptidoglycan hydrolase-like protein with peptidoglycan-binding domain
VFTEDATQLTEDQIGLDKGLRRDVQRRLNGLGFDTKVTGAFSQDTRNVITRWQAARGYPKSGYLNKLQHRALLSEIVATQPATASSSDDDEKPAPRKPQRASGGGGGGGGGGGAAPAPRHSGGGGGADPAAMGRFMGGVVGGVLR